MREIFLVLCLMFPLLAQAQQPFQLQRPRDPNFLSEFQRNQLVSERGLRRGEAREQRLMTRRQSGRCGPQYQWYTGTDGFWIRSY